MNMRKSLGDVRPSWDNLGPFLIITSHIGCNGDGERKPYLVSGIHYDLRQSTVDFSVKELEWRQAYDTMTVKFGSKAGKVPTSSFRTHEALRKRQGGDTFATVDPSSTTPQPTPTPTGLETSVDLANPFNSSQKLDPNMKLFEFATGSGATTQSASVSCKGCTLNGTIDVIAGEFVVSTSTTDIGEIIDFVQDGFFQVAANNLAAHIELDTKFTLSQEKTFEKQLTEFGLPGFSIPNVATVGPFFRPALVSTIKLEGTLEFSYGFDLKVPNNSTLTLPIATSPSIKLTLSAALRGELNFGIVLGNANIFGGAKAEIGAFLDLPALEVAISTAPDLDVNCDPIPTNISFTNVSEIVPQKFPSLIKIEPAVVLNFGVKADVLLDLPGNKLDGGYTTESVIASTSFPLPTACLSFDAEKQQLAIPTTTPPPPPPTTATVVAGATNAPGANPTGQPGTFAEKNGAGTAREMSSQFWWGGLGLLTVFLVAIQL
ncbi:hypothetical protein M7I_5176 [Glarea lozoyensis 74030]|uniref:Uncharacterized protein n=1 Tax=Glarea lozoyensis (strain ATCC 74030 / MF5533) TaxID=1104152 RepID=H0ER60_GLAL7|nr:hypothetical protein M7I_5176 [Glarea lozoyensis 74030]